MATKIAINGFGRIGRCVLRAIHERNLTDRQLDAVRDSGGVVGICFHRDHVGPRRCQLATVRGEADQSAGLGSALQETPAEPLRACWIVAHPDDVVAGEGHHWLGLTLQGVTCNRDAIGAKITWSFGGQTRTRHPSAALVVSRVTACSPRSASPGAGCEL